jgi:triacylglycerol lipase
LDSIRHAGVDSRLGVDDRSVDDISVDFASAATPKKYSVSDFEVMSVFVMECRKLVGIASFFFSALLTSTSVLAEPAAIDTAAGASAKLIADLRYSPNPGRDGLCDLYLPTKTTPPSGHPVVLVVHGGGWSSGDKWAIGGYSRQLARNGFAAVTINYRLAPKNKFPTQVDDIRQALIWIQRERRRYSLDTDRVGLFGYSAGGHLVTLVASLADEPIEVQAGASTWEVDDRRWQLVPKVAAVCAGGPPCDFRILPVANQTLAYFLGGSRGELPDVYRAASPTAHVSAPDPVTQIIHGENDMIVPLRSSQAFHEAQRAAGVDTRLQIMSKQGHLLTFLNPRTGDLVVDFFREVLLKRAE